LIEDGLEAGERVVVDGFYRIRPGAQVKPIPVSEAEISSKQKKKPETKSGGDATGTAERS
jgi:membrane fusion protein (multidrug efflux system)